MNHLRTEGRNFLATVVFSSLSGILFAILVPWFALLDVMLMDSGYQAGPEGITNQIKLTNYPALASVLILALVMVGLGLYGLSEDSREVRVSGRVRILPEFPAGARIPPAGRKRGFSNLGAGSAGILPAKTGS
ncbi:MAG: hypothetical protein D6679_01885 [Candidatus Hydrogenedentota bacterium]|nr:MAG: hypothetical protein D6679_01885 [Candidatus Hydrogenedentota bacterium]